MGKRNRSKHASMPRLAERLEDRPDGVMVWRAVPTKKRKKVMAIAKAKGTVPRPSAPTTTKFTVGPVTIRRGDDVQTVGAYGPADLARVLGGREPMPSELRRLILKRDGYRCRYCRRRKGPWHVDHVHPVALGGTNAYENLVTACRRCNLKKGMQIWQPLPLVEMRR